MGIDRCAVGAWYKDISDNGLKHILIVSKSVRERGKDRRLVIPDSYLSGPFSPRAASVLSLKFCK